MVSGDGMEGENRMRNLPKPGFQPGRIKEGCQILGEKLSLEYSFRGHPNSTMSHTNKLCGMKHHSAKNKKILYKKQ